jgi:pyruvate kinase
VLNIEGSETVCRVEVGGELRSRKGLNLPGIDLGMSAFTDRDRECLKVAVEARVDAIGQSFVERAEDVVALRQAAKDLNYDPFVIAKIERARGLNRIDEILEQADGIMIARGDLGVEVPIEQIAVVQKRLMRKANLLGKPVITATQMLESMTAYPRPTRAESTDVANAILDGTDCVMLSEESAMGRYPVDAVAMLTKIAATVEPWVSGREVRREVLASGPKDQFTLRDLIAASVVATVDRMTPAAVFVPTRTGATARSITRFRLPALIVAVSSHEATCSRLQFSFGVHPVHEPDHPEDWREYARKWLSSHGVEGNLVVLTEGPSSKHPEANHGMEIIDLSSSRK